MCRAIDTFVKHCEVCAANKHSTQRPGGLLQPLENPSSPFQHVTMDFVTNLPVSNRGFDAIFSIVDRFSRLCKFIPCKTSISALEVADLFFEQWVCKYGMPTKIISDRDVKFTSSFWQQLMGLLQCRVALSTSYHPQTDGLTERFHRSIEQVLRCYCSGA